MADNKALNDAIKAAENELTDKIVKDGGKVPEIPEETQEEETQEEEGSEETGGEETETEETTEELSDDEKAEANKLYKALKGDPTGTIKQLMEYAKIELPKDIKPETSDEVAAAKREITKILEEELGESMKFVAGPLGKALDKILAQERQSVEQLRQETQAAHVESEVVRVTEKLSRETKGESKKLEPQMLKLADKIHPAPGVSNEEYIRMLYNLASAGGKKVTTERQLADKIRRNANDLPSRLSGGGRPIAQGEKVPGKDKFTLNEAVSYAIDKSSKRSK